MKNLKISPAQPRTAAVAATAAATTTSTVADKSAVTKSTKSTAAALKILAAACALVALSACDCQDERARKSATTAKSAHSSATASTAATASTDAAQSAANAFAVGEIIELHQPSARKIRLQRTEGGFIDADAPANALLIDIFGTFCPPCRAEAPALFELARSHPRLSLLALSHLERASDAQVRDFATRYAAHYAISNDARNAAVIEAILADIGYGGDVMLPMKVLLRGGRYELLGGEKFLLGPDKRGVIKRLLAAE